MDVHVTPVCGTARPLALKENGIGVASPGENRTVCCDLAERQQQEVGMHRHLGFLVLIVLATAAAATPAPAQTLTPLTQPPNSDTKSAASTPDLSGIWGRWFNLEPPSSGP